MQVSKWGNSLAVRFPAALVQALDLKEGEEIDLHLVGARAFEVLKKPDVKELLARLHQFRGCQEPVVNDLVIGLVGNHNLVIALSVFGNDDIRCGSRNRRQCHNNDHHKCLFHLFLLYQYVFFFHFNPLHLHFHSKLYSVSTSI